MSQLLNHRSHASLKVNHRNHRDRPVRPEGERSAEEVKAMLRDIAFVLKMTERVREQMKNPDVIEDLVHA